eukprot:CAMPEP_0202865630 /NCGR_PEP_ID=MMETSP1391-20130828/6267_1 /ASSEMBLY_ACC=CAM_ASM_000867 /TAXON_ID=1034604 /ORGANISM="Chlamydomonas leiostraca, Strain SAG 11-49" /LENGTH=64 /DNA_ID=CAMNT_0049545493 /DNA_START=492 /DNA_END=684 /DNA_ORIENTATION=-
MSTDAPLTVSQHLAAQQHPPSAAAHKQMKQTKYTQVHAKASGQGARRAGCAADMQLLKVPAAAP